MGTVYKRKRKRPDGRVEVSDRWYIRWVDAAGRQHDNAAYRTKHKSARLMRSRELAADCARLERVKAEMRDLPGGEVSSGGLTPWKVRACLRAIKAGLRAAERLGRGLLKGDA